MPIREDLLEAIEAENPSGPNLYYDKVFEQIKEARIEEDDSLPSGEWVRAAKKADRVFVIKQAGDVLAKQSKDLRLAGWYAESVLRKEGFGQLVPGIELLWKLQESFWETVHPELDEDGNADIRIGAVESASNLIGLSVQALPLTRTGFNLGQYGDARALGYDADERSSEKKEARDDAISFGRATADDLQKAVNATPKAFYIETDGTLTKSLETLGELELFHEEKYGDDYPSLGKLKAAIEDVKRVVGTVLTEKRKTEPDVVEAGEEPEQEQAKEIDSFAQYDAVEETPEATVVRTEVAAPTRKKVAAGVPTDAESAYAQVAVSAEFLRGENAASPVPYLVCSALRLGETRGADLSDGSFAVAPATETRQALRRLASEGSWDELMQLCLRTMVEPCGRMWLDLQRFTWRAAYANGQYAVATAVVSTVRGLLLDLPELRTMTLDDDTPAGNAETQQWIDAEVLPPAPVEEVVEASEPEPELEPVYVPPPASVSSNGVPAAPDIYETALGVLKQGRMNEAISMLVRDSELQPSGRARFHRRVQMAQLCLAADQAAVAYPVLRDLSSEIERRALETWESGEALAQPLSLLLRCLQQRKGTEEEREAIFDRLCRLDPQAALTVKR